MTPLSKLITLLTSCLIITSCMKLHQEYWLETDGSGKFALRMDLGDMINMINELGDIYNDKEQDYGYKGLDSIEMAEDYRDDTTISEVINEMEEYEEFNFDTEDNYSIEDSIGLADYDDWQMQDEVENKPTLGDFLRESIVQKIALDQTTRIDTTMTIYSLLPDSILATIDNPEDLKDFVVMIALDSAASKFVIGIEFSFTDEASLIRKSNLFKSLNQDNSGENIKDFMDDDIQKTFIDYFNQLDEGNQMVINFEKKDFYPEEEFRSEEDENYLEFPRQFMGGLEIKTTFHFPGRSIKSSSFDRAVIGDKGSSIEVKFVLEDYLSKSIPEKMTILFK